MDESTHTYALGEKLQQGRSSSVYRAVRKADGHKVVLRVLDGSDPLAGKIERLKHELDLRSTLHGLPAVEPLALSTLNGVPALELEDFVGEPLDRLVTAPLPVEDFLRARGLGGGRGRRTSTAAGSFTRTSTPAASSSIPRPAGSRSPTSAPPRGWRGSRPPRARSACWRSPSRMSRPNRPGA